MTNDTPDVLAPGMRPSESSFVFLNRMRAERDALCALLLETEQAAKAVRDGQHVTPSREQNYYIGKLDGAAQFAELARARLRAIREGI